jgi:hypothetical protein
MDITQDIQALTNVSEQLLRVSSAAEKDKTSGYSDGQRQGRRRRAGRRAVSTFVGHCGSG